MYFTSVCIIFYEIYRLLYTCTLLPLYALLDNFEQCCFHLICYLISQIPELLLPRVGDLT